MMDDDALQATIRREQLEPLAADFGEDLRIAAAHVEDLRGALDGRVAIMVEPWVAPRPLPL